MNNTTIYSYDAVDPNRGIANMFKQLPNFRGQVVVLDRIGVQTFVPIASMTYEQYQKYIKKSKSKG